MIEPTGEIYRNKLPRQFGNLLLSNYRITQVHHYLLPLPPDPGRQAARTDYRPRILFARAAPGASAPYQIPALAVGQRNKADLDFLFFGLVRAGGPDPAAGNASQGSAGASFKEGTAGVVGFAIGGRYCLVGFGWPV
ncbi:hypothetical protein GCM10008020_35990 [Massilia psychrophila]|nr:hypothetical protein GCM10008020_35990 [Massilia psychrophila]